MSAPDIQATSQIRHLEVVDMTTRETVYRVDVTGRSEHAIERVLRGMLTNMNRERYFVRDTHWSKRDG